MLQGKQLGTFNQIYFVNSNSRKLMEDRSMYQLLNLNMQVKESDKQLMKMKLTVDMLLIKVVWITKS
jgi:hypothetical protein